MMLGLTEQDLWIMGTGVLAAVACGTVGSFLVLRRMSLLGDAISHSILPGLAVAFIITGTRDFIPMFIGALVAGLLTAVLSQGLHQFARVPEDASLGVVFTTLFAFGVLLINWVGRKVDLDPGCVLYGLIEFTPFDTVAIGSFEVPRAFVMLAAVTVVNVLLLSVFFKELSLSSFDPFLATTLGFNAAYLHYGLLIVVAATIVAAFEAVGSILVVTMLIAPGATAHLLTDKLSRMVILSGIVSAVAAVIGYLFALKLNTSVAGMISVVAGVEFLLAALFAPRYGWLNQMIQRALLRLRVAREDLLGALYRAREKGSTGGGSVGISKKGLQVDGGSLPRFALWTLMRDGLVVLQPTGEVALSGEGVDESRKVVRSHRLWETYLSKHFVLPLDHLHEPSHRMEHFITPEIRDQLDTEISETRDPHGRRIPREKSEPPTLKSEK